MTTQIVTKELIEKWSPVIDGTGKWEDFVKECPRIDESFKPIMIQILENTEHDLTEATNAATVGDFKPILIPMLRRIIPNQIGPRILGTWSMTAPQQQIFALRSVFQNTSAAPVTRANSRLIVLADATNFAVGGAISGQASGVGVVRHKEGNNLLVEVSSGTFAVGANVDNAATYSAAETTISAVYDNEALFKIVFKNYAGLYSTADGEALSTDMKEIGFKVDTTTITAETYKLKAKWTEELEDDMRAIHNMNAEMLLSEVATNEIDLELNQKIIEKVRTAAIAGGTTAWSYSSADGRWEIEKYQNLAATVSRVKREIAVANRRGQATFAIVSPAILAALEHGGKLDSSTVDPAQNVYAGKALGMDIFCDIYSTANEVLLGYKGKTELDAGIFLGMYKPITVRKGYGQDDGQPRSFFKSRIGFADTLLGTENYYRRITVASLPS